MASRFCSQCGNQVNPGEKFCGKCGHALEAPTNVATVQNTGTQSSGLSAQKQPNKKKSKMIAIGAAAVSALVVVIVLVVSLVTRINQKYYFDTGVDEEQDTDVVTTGSTSTSTGTTRKGKYATAIVYDNVYDGVKIGGKTDALKLIEQDSVSQKNQCSAEIRKIEDEIIQKYDITAVNLCELDVNFAREIGKVFQKIYDEYPAARGYLTNLSLMNASMSDSFIAAFMPLFGFATADTDSTYPWVIKTQVILNSSYFLNQERLDSSVKTGSATGHFPKNATMYSPVAHELGHYLSFLAMMEDYGVDSILLVDSKNLNGFYNLMRDFSNGKHSLEMIEEAYDNYKRDTGDNPGLDAWRGTISQYALAKDNSGNYIYDETIAEAFHDVYLNGSNASTASKYVVDVLKKRLR